MRPLTNQRLGSIAENYLFGFDSTQIRVEIFLLHFADAAEKHEYRRTHGAAHVLLSL